MRQGGERALPVAQVQQRVRHRGEAAGNRPVVRRAGSHEQVGLIGASVEPCGGLGRWRGAGSESRAARGERPGGLAGQFVSQIIPADRDRSTNQPGVILQQPRGVGRVAPRGAEQALGRAELLHEADERGASQLSHRCVAQLSPGTIQRDDHHAVPTREHLVVGRGARAASAERQQSLSHACESLAELAARKPHAGRDRIGPLVRAEHPGRGLVRMMRVLEVRVTRQPEERECQVGVFVHTLRGRQRLTHALGRPHVVEPFAPVHFRVLCAPEAADRGVRSG